MIRILAKSTVGARPAELMALIIAGPRGGRIGVIYLSAADALVLAGELEAAARDLFGKAE